MLSASNTALGNTVRSRKHVILISSACLSKIYINEKLILMEEFHNLTLFKRT